MTAYIALVRKDPETSYGINFPDFPGFVSGGESLSETLRSASEGLAFHIEAMREGGEQIPEPSNLDTILADPENQDADWVRIAPRP